jgi:hypothetical protein
MQSTVSKHLNMLARARKLHSLGLHSQGRVLGGMYSGSQFGVANFMRGRVLPGNTGSFFHFLVDFYPFWAISSILGI